jgi:polyisoprenoid-binding protein YceI
MTDTTYDTAASQAVSDLSGTYTVDASHSRLGFTARHAMVTNVKGSFGSFEGTVVIDTAEPGRLVRERHHRRGLGDHGFRRP